MFRRPSEGQSLISYLSEQDFGSCADLEKVRNLGASEELMDWENLAQGFVALFRLIRFQMHRMTHTRGEDKFPEKIS